MSHKKTVRIAASLIATLFFVFACNRPETPPPLKSDPISTAPVPTPKSDVDSGETQETAPVEFEIIVREEPYETFVDIRLPNAERPSLHWRPDSKQLFLTWSKEMSSEAQIEILRRMVERLHARDGARFEQAKLHVTLDMYQYPAYVERLARAAAEEDRLASTKRKNGVDTLALHARVIRLSNEQQLTPELDAVFTPLGVRPQIVHVEKCSDARPGNGNVLDRFLRDQGIKSTKRLPVGCLMSTFTLAPEPPKP